MLSRCRLGLWVGWVHGTMYERGNPDPLHEWANVWGNGAAQCNVYAENAASAVQNGQCLF